ncbi:hypothetical protein [Microcoleus sp. BROC3]|uniref:hypothetical protein n=1 Tax=Microcoleus sp. BROC3 TaxID=3055323 RepID=UPI002FD571DF
MALTKNIKNEIITKNTNYIRLIVRVWTPKQPIARKHRRCHETAVTPHSSPLKENAKIVDHTILELIFDTCTRARKRPSLAL